MPSFSWITFTTGAKQFVVHDAAVINRCFAASYNPSFTPITMLSASPPFTGAATITFLTPRSKYASNASGVRNFPEHSNTTSTP